MVAVCSVPGCGRRPAKQVQAKRIVATGGKFVARPDIEDARARQCIELADRGARLRRRGRRWRRSGRLVDCFMCLALPVRMSGCVAFGTLGTIV